MISLENEYGQKCDKQRMKNMGRKKIRSNLLIASMLSFLMLFGCENEVNQAGNSKGNNCSPHKKANERTWRIEYSGNEKLVGIWGCSENNIYAIGYERNIVRFDGKSWVQKTINKDLWSRFYDIWGTSCSDIIIVGSDGLMLRFDGNKWNRIQLVLNGMVIKEDIGRVWAIDPEKVFIAERKGYVYELSDGNLRKISEHSDYESLFGFASNDLYWVTNSRQNGIVHRYDGVEAKVISKDLFAANLWGTSPGNMWIAGPRIYQYNGTSWSEKVKNNIKEEFVGVIGSTGNNLYSFGYSAGYGLPSLVLHYNGKEWLRLKTGSNVYSLLDGYIDPMCNMYLVGGNYWNEGKILKHQN